MGNLFSAHNNLIYMHVVVEGLRELTCTVMLKWHNVNYVETYK